MSESPRRIGLVGLSQGSWASKSHLNYLRTTSRYTISALQNSSKASAEAAAKQFGLDNVSTHADSKSLVSDPNVDIIAVSVKVPLHYNLVKPSIEAGKDVFVEWPLAANLAEATELTNLAKEKGIRTMVGLQARQSPTILKAKEIVASGKLGKILNTTMFGHGMVFGPIITKDLEYLCPIEAGANLLTIPFGHNVDALCFVLGEMDTLSATLLNQRPQLSLVDDSGKEVRKVEKTAHDHISVTGTLVDGGLVDVTFLGGTSRTGRNFHWEINGTEGSLVFEGNLGMIQMWDPVLKFVGNEPGAKLEVVEVEKAGDSDKGDFSYNVGKAWDAWAVGENHGHTVTTFEDALVRHKMIEAIYRSAKNGTTERYL